MLEGIESLGVRDAALETGVFRVVGDVNHERSEVAAVERPEATSAEHEENVYVRDEVSVAEVGEEIRNDREGQLGEYGKEHEVFDLTAGCG